MSEAKDLRGALAGDTSPAFPDLLREGDLAEVAKAISRVGQSSTKKSQASSSRLGDTPDATVFRPSCGPLQIQHMHRPGWLQSMGITRVDLNVMVPVQGHVPQAFLIWWQRLRQDLSDQLGLMDQCAFEEMPRRGPGP